MTHRIRSSFKSLAVFAAFRIAANRDRTFDVAEPEPLVRDIDDARQSDDWMFAGHESAVSHSADAYTHEMSRVSGALSGLRALLTQISHHVPTQALHAEALPFGPLASEPLLFDGEAMAATYGPVPFEDADLFEDVSMLASERARDSDQFARVA